MKQIPEIKSIGQEYCTENNHIYVMQYREIIDENNNISRQAYFHTKYKSNSLCGKESLHKDKFGPEKITDILNNKEICPLCLEEFKKLI